MLPAHPPRRLRGRGPAAASRGSLPPPAPGRSSRWSTSSSTRSPIGASPPSTTTRRPSASGARLIRADRGPRAQPAGLRDALVTPGDGVGHIAWLADSLEDETARLTRSESSRFTPAAPARCRRSGSTAALFGHPIEVLQRCDELLGFYAMVRAAAADWDGSEPLRVLTGASSPGIERRVSPARSTSSSSASVPPARARRSPPTMPAPASPSPRRRRRRQLRVLGRLPVRRGRAAAVDHLDALCFGKTDRAVLEASRGLHEVPAGSTRGRPRRWTSPPSAACFPRGRTSRRRAGRYRQYAGADGPGRPVAAARVGRPDGGSVARPPA